MSDKQRFSTTNISQTKQWLLLFDPKAAQLTGSNHCDLVDQAKLKVADTKKGAPKDPHLTFDLKVDDQPRAVIVAVETVTNSDVAETSTCSLTSTSDVVEEQSSSCNTRFSVVEGDGTGSTSSSIKVTAELNTRGCTVSSVNSNHDVLTTSEGTEGKGVLTVSLTEVVSSRCQSSPPENTTESLPEPAYDADPVLQRRSWSQHQFHHQQPTLLSGAPANVIVSLPVPPRRVE